MNGAQTGDLSMSLIHAWELCGANSFEYVIEFQKPAAELASEPVKWMFRTYRETLCVNYS